MENLLPAKNESTGVEAVESARAVQEVQASLVVAKRFPRDEFTAYTKIMKSCERPTLAKNALYAFPKGGQMVTGPSIRLAEALAQAWGNLDFGIRELTQRDGVSEVEAYAWDLETNTRQTKTFQVKHSRYTKTKGVVALTDPRDQYEMVANQSARRMRACILGVIPGDIVDAAVAKCEETMQKGDGKPLKDRVRQMISVFSDLGVTQGMVEARLGHNLDATVETEVVSLGKIYKSIKDNMSKRDDWFDIVAPDKQKATELTDKVKGKKTPPMKDFLEKVTPLAEKMGPEIFDAFMETEGVKSLEDLKTKDSQIDFYNALKKV